MKENSFAIKENWVADIFFRSRTWDSEVLSSTWFRLEYLEQIEFEVQFPIDFKTYILRCVAPNPYFNNVFGRQEYNPHLKRSDSSYMKGKTYKWFHKAELFLKSKYN